MTWKIHPLLKAKVPAFVVASPLAARPTRSAPKLPTTLDHRSQGAWPLTSCAPPTFASSGVLHILSFLFSVLLTSPLLWRGVLDTLAVALIPALFSLGLFALTLLDLANFWDANLGIRRRFHTSDSGVCFFLSFLIPAGLAWRFFSLFCFLESTTRVPMKRGPSQREREGR